MRNYSEYGNGSGNAATVISHIKNNISIFRWTHLKITKPNGPLQYGNAGLSARSIYVYCYGIRAPLI